MNQISENLIFDVGMFDGTDTKYYLESGFSVVAVEANPNLAAAAATKFKTFIDSGKLTIVNAAISDQTGSNLEFFIPTHDQGSTTANPEKLSNRIISNTFSVATITITDLFRQFGRPYFIKIDIEGHDRHCVLPLTQDTRPPFLSFEAGPDLAELVTYLQQIGFHKFRAISQCNFITLQKQNSLTFRIRLKALHLLGFRDPRLFRIGGSYFRVEHGSGPFPWKMNDPWLNASELLSDWEESQEKGHISGWYDIHASTDFR